MLWSASMSAFLNYRTACPMAIMALGLVMIIEKQQGPCDRLQTRFCHT